MTCREAIQRAIQKDSLKIVDTRWTDAGALKPPEWMQIGDDIDGEAAGDVFVATLFGFSLLGYVVSIISLDRCKRDCRGNKGTGGGGGGEWNGGFIGMRTSKHKTA